MAEVPFPHMSDEMRCARIRDRAHDVTEAVQMAAWHHGITLAEHQARLIAEVDQTAWAAKAKRLGSRP